MSVFTENELEYLRQQRMGRLATVDFHGNPRVGPVGFRYNPETDTIDIGGFNFAQTRKWRDAKRHPRVSFVIDDVLPPWQARAPRAWRRSVRAGFFLSNYASASGEDFRRGSRWRKKEPPRQRDETCTV